jgi:hypothetical protein
MAYAPGVLLVAIISKKSSSKTRNVQSGKADIDHEVGNVRFVPKSGLMQRSMWQRLRAGPVK